MTDSSSSSKPPRSCDFEADKLDLKLSVTMAGDRDAVDPVVRSVMNVVREMKSAPSKTIECDVACDEERGILIIVRDPGPGFDPAQIANPCHGENIYENHGRGIYLINQLMDEVEFHKNGTEIHMLKK